MRFSIKIGRGERFRKSQFQRTVIYSLREDEKRYKDPSEEEVPAPACGSQRGLQRPGKWELVCVHPSAVWPFRRAGFPWCISSQACSNEDSVSLVTHVSTLWKSYLEKCFSCFPGQCWYKAPLPCSWSSGPGFHLCNTELPCCFWLLYDPLSPVLSCIT